MRICPNCNYSNDDSSVFCQSCGVSLAATAAPKVNPVPGAAPNQPPYTNVYSNEPPVYPPPVDPYDHTAEFDPKDISDNKVVCMLVYLMGAIGIIIALLIGSSSPYVSFHVRQALKFIVVNVLMTIVMVLLCWTFIVPFAYIVMTSVFTVIKIICFVQICQGKAKEPAIIRSLTFLK